MRKSMWMLVVAATGALAVAAAGCGGGGSKSSAPPSTTTTTESTTTASTAQQTTTTSTQSTTAIPNFATSGNCKSLADAANSLSQAMSSAKGDLQKQAAIFKQFADKAPSEIRSDVETLAGDFTKVAAALKGVNVKSGQAPSPAVLARLASLSKQIDQAKLLAAETHIQAWVQKNCHA